MKAKEEEETKFKERANLFIPLVDEHSDDIKTAKRTDFISGSSSDEKRKKRLEIKTQSVFDSTPSSCKGSSSSKLKTGESSSSSSSRKSGAGAGSHERARQTLLKACGKMDTGIFGSPRSGGRGTPTKEKRNLLGIRTK